MNSLPSLMARLEIKAVYWIDDENAEPKDLDPTKLAGMLADQLVASDPDVRRDALKQLKKHEKAQKLANSIGKALHEEADIDPVERVSNLLIGLDKVVEDVVATLNEMLDTIPHPLAPEERAGLAKLFQGGENWAWNPMSFSRWNDEHKSILEKHATGSDNALLLVDLQNTRETAPVSGEQIFEQWAKYVSKTKTPAPIYAVALTSKYDRSEELIEGRRFTKKLFDSEQDPPVPVLVVAKNRFSSDRPDADKDKLIADAIESTLSRLRACTLHAGLAHELGLIFQKSTTHAFDTLQQLSIEEMIYAVSASSYHEGASEVDTLVRMASIAQRKALLAELIKSKSIPDTLIELRGLHDQIGFVTAQELDSADGIEQLRQSELHDPAEVVNQLLSPITSGDIFEVTNRSGDTEYHVLISNACDLALRGPTGARKLDHGLLLLLKQEEEGAMAYPISHFPDSSPLANKSQSVDLRRMLTVPLDVLDLCWTNTGGICRWSREDSLPKPFSLLPSQRNRYGIISERMRAIQSEEGLAAVVHWAQRTCLFDEEAKGLKEVIFSIKRIGRLSTNIAVELNNKFAQVIARPSQEHNFSAN